MEAVGFSSFVNEGKNILSFVWRMDDIHVACVGVHAKLLHAPCRGYDKIIFCQAGYKDDALRVAKKEVTEVRATLNGQLDAIHDLYQEIIIHKFDVVCRHSSCGGSAVVNAIRLIQCKISYCVL